MQCSLPPRWRRQEQSSLAFCAVDNMRFMPANASLKLTRALSRMHPAHVISPFGLPGTKTTITRSFARSTYSGRQYCLLGEFCHPRLHDVVRGHSTDGRRWISPGAPGLGGDKFCHHGVRVLRSSVLVLDPRLGQELLHHALVVARLIRLQPLPPKRR